MRGLLILLVILILFSLTGVNGAKLSEQFEKNYVTIGTVNAGATIQIADFNSDGKIDGAAVLDGTGRLVAYEFSGIMRYVKNLVPGNTKGALVAADLDGNGYKDDIVAGTRYVYAFDPNGNEIWKFDPNSSVNVMAVTYIDGNRSTPEIIVGAWKKVIALNKDGKELWVHNYNYGGNPESITITDFNDDGVSDGVVFGTVGGITALDKNGNVIWTKNTGDVIYSLASIDLNGNGYIDGVVAGMANGTVLALNKTGNIVWKYYKYIPTDRRIVVKAADLNSNKVNDDVVVLANSVYALNAHGQSIFFERIFGKTFTTVDFGDTGILNDIAVGSDTKIMAIDSTGQEIGYYIENGKKISPYNKTGADVLAPADIDGDGYLDDLIGIKGNTVFLLSHIATATTPKRIIVVGNCIDSRLAIDFFEFLRNSGFEVIHIFPEEFNSYKNEKNIVILGGQLAPDGTGEIVSNLLTPQQKSELEKKGAVKVFKFSDIYTMGQKITVFAGNNREGTRQAQRLYRGELL